MSPPRKHLGGELPAFSDRLDSKNPLPQHCLPFSHGRAALTWIIKQYGFRSVLLCAYTCPSVTECFLRLGLKIAHYDIGESEESVICTLSQMSVPLVLTTALFGGKPLLDPELIEDALVDAAQTAFGYRTHPFSLSCPRKTTSLSDGAILRFPGWSRTAVNRLPLASQAIALKTTARMLWRDGHNELAIGYNERAEQAWPLEPCQMSPKSLHTLERMDVNWHEQKRRGNYNVLKERLHDLPYHEIVGVPFCYPILVKNRDETLETLHYERIYANKLWWNADFDRGLFPVAAVYADQLICLPVDQRHTQSDMERIADIVLCVAEH